MAHQSPMISIPKKATDEVDWTTPIRSLISQSYGESPDNYSTECAALQRCRQDAVRGAGSDITARDLLYKYFGQLELLELRFSEIRVNFPWRDAFTNKLITQTSIAYEKASILFQIAATHSAIASAQSRSDPEGLKRAFYYFKTCAGMLTYINENFLHAPSTDLSREVVKFLVNVILAQATEVFFEKCTEEKKGNALVSKIGAQAASMYTSLCEEVKEFTGKGILDRNWVTLITIKSKYFTSLSHYYRGLADSTAGKHGDALARFTIAENLAKEASRAAVSFGSIFVSTMSPTMPSDAGPSIQDRTKAHLALMTDKRSEAHRENDLIYNAVVPTPEALPPIDKTVVAVAIPIQDVYGTPDVQKTIGPDLFIRLVPLSVHESASVYSEEKAKLVRGEVEKAEGAEGELRSALDGLGVKDGLVRFRAIAEGEVGSDAEVPVDVQKWRADITVIEEREGVDTLIDQLGRLKSGVQGQLEAVAKDLDGESRECEALRVKYEHRWTLEPSAGPSKSLRQDLKSHFGSLEAASASDRQVLTIWDAIKGDIRTLISAEVEEVFRASTDSNSGQDLLDLDLDEASDDKKERAKIGRYVSDIDERLNRLNKISRERNEVLKDLKDKIQTDDVSHILLLNRRNTGVEPALFAAELEKFRPYQQRLEAMVQHQDATIEEITTIWKKLKAKAGRGPGARRWEEREKRKNDTVKRFSRARDAYMEVRDGLSKGLQFYRELTELCVVLHRNSKQFITGRIAERDGLANRIEVEKRLTAASSPPPPPPRPSEVTSSLASMSLQSRPPAAPPGGGSQTWSNTPPPPSNWQNSYSSTPSAPPPPPPVAPYGHAPQSYNSPGPQSTPYLPPPPPQPSQSAYLSQGRPAHDPYESLGMFGATPPPPPQSQQGMAPPPPQQQQQPQYGQTQYPYYQQQQHQPQYSMPPPPPTASYGSPPPLSQNSTGSPAPPPNQSYTGPSAGQNYASSPAPPQGQNYGGFPPQQQGYYNQGYSQ